MRSQITVKAEWDPEAEVWYTEYSSLPGLNLVAETIDALRQKSRTFCRVQGAKSSVRTDYAR
jgi:hypothetical protein